MDMESNSATQTNNNPDGGQSAGDAYDKFIQSDTLVTDGADKETQAESAPDDKDNPADGADKKDPADVAPAKPDDYKFEYADGISIDKGMESSFRNTAHELGLTQKQAQSLVAMYAKEQDGAVGKFEDRITENMKKTDAAWMDAFNKRPDAEEIKGNVRAVFRRYGDAETTRFLNETRIGNAPQFIDFLNRIGKDMQEPGFAGKTGSGQKSQADVIRSMYDKSNHK